ncbi:rhodanese domain-containing protein CG4456-like isoform X2 [Hetaerina americana]|uniref:rhodanese domain-containing protein CG4456-like isoform X2 n=1 Tax=Hetaerina americana TaxID=62018 RepID=UPI003A7F2443
MLIIRRCAYSLIRLHSLCWKASYSTSTGVVLHRKRLFPPAVSTVFWVSRAMEHTDLDYNELIEVRKSRDILLIDVRNRDELEGGSIPDSINVPLGELEAALKMDDQEFETQYKHKKPEKDAEIVFSCRSGNRSRRAMDLARTLGYDKSKHYIGGWLDWAEKTKN